MLVAGLRNAPVAALPEETLLVAVDPLDASSNIDTNVSVGTIFSVLRAPTEGSRGDADAFLQTGVRHARLLG
jgi:fructose-1,6-bisphosphatase